MVNRDVAMFVRKMVDKVISRLRGLVTRASIQDSTVTGQGQVVTARMLQGETRPGAEYFEPYGIAGAVPEGSTGVALAVGGSRDHVIVVCASPKGGTPEGRQAGEVDIYSRFGQRIRLHLDGSISLLPDGTGQVYLGSDVNPALPQVARNGDSVPVSASFAAWAANVTAALNVVPGTVTAPVPTTAGSVTATSSNVRAN